MGCFRSSNSYTNICHNFGWFNSLLAYVKEGYICITLRKDFNPSWKVIKDILLVGIPASAEFFVMSILGIVLNIMLVITGGTEAVAVYTAGWRLVMIAMIPAIGIGTAAITVAGAAYGLRDITIF